MLRRERDAAYISTVIAVFRIAASGYSRVRGNTRVDCVDAPERVDVRDKIRKGFVGAGLESRGITTSSSVKRMDGGQNCICIFSRTTSASVCCDVASRRVPVRLHSDVNALHNKRNSENILPARSRVDCQLGSYSQKQRWSR